MKQNNLLLLFLISFSFLFYNINSRRNINNEFCFNEFDFLTENNDQPESQWKNESKYYFKDKNIKYTFDKQRLKMNFTGIQQFKDGSDPDSNYKVTYKISFYDKEKLGLDSIKAVLEDEKSLYNYTIVKSGKDTKGTINWEVDVKENGDDNKHQIAQLFAEASFEDIVEIYPYESFIFKYSEKQEKEKEDRTFEFWLIFGGFMGIIVISFLITYVYIYATMEFGRRTLMLNNIPSTFDESSSDQDRESKQSGSRTTA